MTAAHEQHILHQYTIHYPDHAPREGDPHYHAFEAWRKAHKGDAICFIGARVGFDECADAQGNPIPVQPDNGRGLELHHHFLEFAVVNEAYLAALEVDFPTIDTPEKAAEWAESDANFMWLCAKHHRGHGGAHTASYADFSAEEYVRDLIS